MRKSSAHLKNTLSTGTLTYFSELSLICRHNHHGNNNNSFQNTYKPNTVKIIRLTQYHIYHLRQYFNLILINKFV